mmetsp:Transcript_10094/g.38228  ORF Transcript_10094/g.38228 Transcript_10094/m.38228 type:complete len:264 (+) Transcript_10094:1771-2562(+)
MTPAPSPITKPPLASSKGRESAATSSPSRGTASARSCENPATLSGSTCASTPPASMVVAIPRRMKLYASPMECAPVAHAVDTAWLGPLRSNRREIAPAALFGSTLGTKRGSTLRAPRFASFSAFSATSRTDAIPTPMLMPIWGPPTSSSAASTASTAARRASFTKRGSLRRSSAVRMLLSKASAPTTTPAKLLESFEKSAGVHGAMADRTSAETAESSTRSSGSKGRIPLCDRKRPFHSDATDDPRGVTAPMPVTTTLFSIVH